MKRKVIELAGKSLLISLPKKSTVNLGIKKGHELEIEEIENGFLIKTQKQEEKSKTAVLNIDTFDTTLIRGLFQDLYRKGYNEIKLNYTQDFFQDIKRNKDWKNLELLYSIANAFTGIEIISQSKNFCTLKQISTPTAENYDNVFKKIHFSIINLVEDYIAALKSEDYKNLEDIHQYRDILINRLVDYCINILNKTKEKDLSQFNTLLNLERIADKIVDSAGIILNQKSIPKNYIDKLEHFQKILNQYFKLYYKPNKESIKQFSIQRHEFRKHDNTDVLTYMLTDSINGLWELSLSRSHHLINVSQLLNQDN